MVVCTVGAVATIMTGGLAAAAGAGAGAAVGTGGGLTGAAVAGAAAGGSSAGAIAGASAAAAATGATAASTAAGAGVGAVAGGLASGGSCGSMAGMTALAAGTGGWGLLAIGTSANSDDGQITYDCWKPVVHDTSTELSSGMLLRDMVCHPNIAKVTMTAGICTELPNIVIQNIWQETFEIQYLLIHGIGKLACHAKPVDK